MARVPPVPQKRHDALAPRTHDLSEEDDFFSFGGESNTSNAMIGALLMTFITTPSVCAQIQITFPSFLYCVILEQPALSNYTHTHTHT